MSYTAFKVCGASKFFYFLFGLSSLSTAEIGLEGASMSYFEGISSMGTLTSPS
jgi:hypothetical protein